MRFETDQEREAVRLLASGQMKPLLAMFQRHASENVANLMTLGDEVALRRTQGKAQYLHDLLSAVQRLNAE